MLCRFWRRRFPLRRSLRLRFRPPRRPPRPLTPAAVELLGKAAAAYKSLNTLSQTFSIVDKRGDKETVTTGTWMFERPDKARVEVESNGKRSLTLSDGRQIVSQVAPDAFRRQDVDKAGDLSPIATVAFRIPGAATGPLSTLLDGKNLLVEEIDNFAAAQLSPQGGDDGLTFITKTEGEQPPVTFRMFFNPKTHLLTRVQGEIEVKGVQYSKHHDLWRAHRDGTAPLHLRFARRRQIRRGAARTGALRSTFGRGRQAVRADRQNPGRQSVLARLDEGQSRLARFLGDLVRPVHRRTAQRAGQLQQVSSQGL